MSWRLLRVFKEPENPSAIKKLHLPFINAAQQVAQFPINIKKSGKISRRDVENTFSYNLLHLRLASLRELPMTNMEFPPSSRQKLGGCNSIIFVLPLLLLHKYCLTRRERCVSGDHLLWQCSRLWIFSDCLGWNTWEQVPFAKICLISSPPDRKHAALSYNGSNLNVAETL